MRGYQLIWFCVGLTWCIAGLSPENTFAEDLDRAVIEGQVVDSNGDAITGATVIVREQQTAFQRTTTTDRSGRYRLAALPPGRYAIQAAFPGFATREYSNLELLAGRTLGRDFRLEPATLIEQINVHQDAPPAIDTHRTIVGTTFTSIEIDTLPLNGRDPLDLVFLLSNVQAEPFEIRDLGDPATRDEVEPPPTEAGNFSLAGGRAYSNNITVNGFDNNDDREAREQTSPSLEEVEAVQVITNQYSAKYGRASGGRVNLLTMRGGNRYHGRLFVDDQDDALNANSFFRNARRQPRLPYQRRHVGGRLSGPLLRHRLFFFGVYERRDERDLDSVIALLPVDPLLNPLYPLNEIPPRRGEMRDGVEVGLLEEDVLTPGAWTTVSGRADYNLNAAHQLAFRFNSTLTNNLRARNVGATVRSGLLNRQRDAWVYQVQHDWVVGPAQVNELGFQFSRFTPKLIPEDRRPGVVVGSSSGTEPFILGTGFIAGASGFPEDRAARRWQLTDAFSWQRNRHEFKLGADIMVLRSTTMRLNRFFGFYNFAGFDDFAQSQPSRFRQRIGQPGQLIRNTILGFYLEEEWRLQSNLTLSLGLRYDRETLLADDKNNVGPRVALAWDPFSRQKTVVRAGFGMFYNRVLLRTFDDFIVESPLFEIDLGNRAGATGPLSALERIGGFPHIFPNDPNDPRVRDLIRPIFDTRRLSPDLRIPYSIQASLGIERELGKEWVVEANYTLHRGVKLWRDQNINAPIPPSGGFISFLVDPPASYPGIMVLSDGTKVFDNRQRQIADVAIPFVQFDLSSIRQTDVGRGNSRRRIFGLNALGGGASSTDPIDAALNAVRYLRPHPALGEIEQLQSDGQSIYHGLTLSLKRHFGHRVYFHASYTLSKLLDDTVVNTTSPQDEFNFALERSLGRTDERHRFVLTGRFILPGFLAAVQMSPILWLTSGRPFNITTNGQDRNLSDVSTDRPDFHGAGPIHYVRPGDTGASEAMARLFTFATIGTSGTLARNAGQGPGIKRLDLRLTREFRLHEHLKLQPWIDVYNVTNTSNFLMNGFIGPLDTRSQQSTFLQPRAARKPRTVELGLRLEF
jgi:hypothetical protein